MNRNVVIVLGASVALVAAAGAGYWFAMGRMQHGAPVATAPAPTAEPGKKVLYWHDPMYPTQKFDKPGKSPFMDMMLVPVYAESDDKGGVAISPRVAQNLGVRTAEAKRGALAKSVEAVGAVAFNERDVTVVQARVTGYVEKLFVRAPLDPVAKGQPLAEILAPDWVAAQEEYLALRASALADDTLRRAARQRLLVAGMPEETIAAVEASGKPRARITVVAPSGGVVGELGTREGATVAAGTMLFRINGLSSVWVNAEFPESQAGSVRPGAKATATVLALPGETFPAQVTTILPEVTAATRTLRARVEIANVGGKLKPGMYATVTFSSPAAAEAILVPTEAVIATGTRTIVVVATEGEGGSLRFAPAPVETGAEAQGMTEIRKGIAAGQRVVVSGQFLIDSEASLKTATARMDEPKGAVAAPAAPSHPARGKVEAVSATSVTISHGPIPGMQMGAMTMPFAVTPGLDLAGVKPGVEVDFAVRLGTKGIELAEIKPRAGAKP